MQLGQLREIESRLNDMGYQILAVGADRPAKLQPFVAEHEYKYRLLSDSTAEAARAFGLAFRVDNTTFDQYKGFGIDLEDASGEKHHILPVPAVYLVGADGVIDFAYVNPDHRQRLAPQVLLAAAEAALK